MRRDKLMSNVCVVCKEKKDEYEVPVVSYMCKECLKSLIREVMVEVMMETLE